MGQDSKGMEVITFEDLLNRYSKVVIPMIQRDYVQGRSKSIDGGRAEDIRNQFLKDLFSGNATNLNLIFGSKDKENFIPLDGQQRLTTLFLLHVYKYKLIDKCECPFKDKFSYDTRRAARDFCKALVSESWDGFIQRDGEHTDHVSYIIKNSIWFMDYWQYDPTVDSMLRMLDCIHEEYKKDNNFPNLKDIKFIHYDMDEHKLTENLYLKMNARGKALTSFENLKSSIEEFISKYSKKEELRFPEEKESQLHGESFKEAWTYHMDRGWTEFFWNHRKNSADFSIDIPFTHFISRFLAGYSIIYKIHSDKNANDLCINMSSNDEYLSFDPIKKVLEVEGALEKLAEVLMDFSENEAASIIKSKVAWAYDIFDIDEYKSLAIIHGYLISKDEKWMRFVWNMAENTVNGKDGYLAFCSRVKEIISHNEFDKGAGILRVLSNIEFKGQISSQLKEEIEKAKQSFNDESWYQNICEAEEFAFFKGSIRFLYKKSNDILDWASFDRKFANAKKYFDKNGVKSEYNVELTKALFKRIDSWNLIYNKQIFNPNAYTWKFSILCYDGYDGNYIPVINDILCADTLDDIEFFEINDVRLKKIIKDFVISGLLEFIVQHHKDFRFRWNNSYLSLYAPNNKGGCEITFDYSDCQRSMILNDSSFTVRNGKEVGNTHHFFGWNIPFTYRGYYFSWQNGDCIDLCSSNWGKKLESYCVRVDKNVNISVDEIKAKLDYLIDRYNDENTLKASLM